MGKDQSMSHAQLVTELAALRAKVRQLEASCGQTGTKALRPGGENAPIGGEDSGDAIALEGEERTALYLELPHSGKDRALQGIYRLELLIEQLVQQHIEHPNGTEGDLESLLDCLVQEIMPSSMQFPEHARVILQVDNRTYANTEEPPAFGLTAPIRASSMERGVLQAGYERAPASGPECDLHLINTFAAMIGRLLRQVETLRDVWESEKRFEVLQSASFGGIAIHDQGLILDCNLGLSEITSHSLEELVGMDVLQLIAEHSRDEVRRNIETGYEEPYEAVGLRKNGAQYPLRVQGKNIPYQGRMVRAAEFRDITETRSAEEAQRVLHDRLSALWGIAKLTESSHKELCDMVLKEVQRLTGSKFAFFGLMDDAERALLIHTWSQDTMAACKMQGLPLHFPLAQAGLWAQAVSDHAPFISNNYDAPHPGKRGLPEGHVPIMKLLSVPILRQGKVVALAAVANKETDYNAEDAEQVHAFVSNILLLLERRRAEDALQEREVNLRNMVDNTPMPMAVHERGGKVVLLNKAFIHKFGYTLEEFPDLETGFPLMYPDPDYRKEAMRRWENAIANAEQRNDVIYGGEYAITAKNGKEFIADIIGMPVDDTIVVVLQDVTARKKTEAYLREAKQKAEQASQMKTEFLANMSHEIRTPLNGMVGMLQLLSLSELDQEQQELVQNAILSGRRLTRLLSDILDLSAVEAGKLSVRICDVNIAELLQTVKSLLGEAAKEKGLDLDFAIDPKLPETIRGDATRIWQVLLNLVGNAIRFTSAGGVTLCVSALAPLAHPSGGVPSCGGVHTSGGVPSCGGVHTSGGVPSCGGVLFTVSDTGPGIADEDLDKAFELFSQVSQGYTRTHQGAGLGLPLVKRIVALLGGAICVASELGKGSTFYVSLPLPQEEACAPQQECEDEGRPPALYLPASAPPPAPAQRILLVEDEPISALAVAHLLTKNGYHVATATSGAEALRVLSDGCFDAILMDIQLPGMDGLETTRSVRAGDAGEHNRHIPVVAMSASSMEGEEEALLPEGITGFISKPVVLESLLSALQWHTTST